MQMFSFWRPMAWLALRRWPTQSWSLNINVNSKCCKKKHNNLPYIINKLRKADVFLKEKSFRLEEKMWPIESEVEETYKKLVFYSWVQQMINEAKKKLQLINIKGINWSRTILFISLMDHVIKFELIWILLNGFRTMKNIVDNF